MNLNDFRPFSLDHLQQRLGNPANSPPEQIRVDNIPKMNQGNFESHKVQDLS